jgi:hypothetical protein
MDRLLTKMALPFLTGKWEESYQNVWTKGLEVSEAKTTAIEHLDFLIDPIGKAIVEASSEVIEDLFPHLGYKTVKTKIHTLCFIILLIDLNT